MNSYILAEAEVSPQTADGGLQSWAVLISNGCFLPLTLLSQFTCPGWSRGAALTALHLLSVTD